jgi:hypothetical protein
MTLGVSVATLTRPFGATSPIEGEVMCALHPLHLAPGGRGRLRSSRVRGAELGSQNPRDVKRPHRKGRKS